MAAQTTWSTTELLALGAAVNTFLLTANVHLYNAVVPINPNTPLATFIAALPLFGGYAPIVPPTVGSPYLPGSGGASVAASGLQWNYAMTPGDTIYGWFVTDAANTSLFAAGSFDAPFTLNALGDAINLDLIFNIGADGQIETILDGQVQ